MQPLRVCFALALASILSTVASAQNWPEWRGPDGNGVSHQTGLPLHWSETSGLAWKCDLPAWGHSTPVIWGDALFLTTQVDDDQLRLLKIDKNTGKVLWNEVVGHDAPPRPASGKRTDEDRSGQFFHKTQNLASPSPVTDGEVVIAHFGNGDLAAYDFQGHPLWKRNLQQDFGKYSIWWGHANSPVLYHDLVLSVCIQDTCADRGPKPKPSYVVAHDKRTGQQRWFTLRETTAVAEDGDSYVTPVLWPHGDRQELLVMGGLIFDGYDPATGQRLWQLSGLEGSRVITGIALGDGMAVITQGKRAPMLGVKLGARGTLGRDAILWQHDKATPDSSTPVICNGLVFSVADNGIAQCLDAKTGQVQWEQRLKGQYRASPLAADGRIYFHNIQGLTTVVRAAAPFEQLAENSLDDASFASPIVSGQRLYLRAKEHLYCIEP